jgi:hypothetical protein
LSSLAEGDLAVVDTDCYAMATRRYGGKTIVQRSRMAENNPEAQIVAIRR